MVKAQILEITDKALQELFDRCGGRRSHYLILNDEPKEFISLLEKEGWISYLNNGSKRPWYTATPKLIEKFRPLNELEKLQLNSLMEEEEQEKIDIALNLANKQKVSKGETFVAAKVEEPTPVAITSISGPDGAVFSSISEAALFLGVHTTTIRKWIKDPENLTWKINE